MRKWLAGFVILTLIMITVGGITRLTRSGLSIVEWKPVVGIIPPITDQDWQLQFDLYRQSPEFMQVNSNFTMAEYKNIFMWEYIHRVLGWFIFFYVLIPGIIFWRRREATGQIVFGLSSLVALQGLIGWLMVKSGLNVQPQVSPYMLTLHFFSALFLMLVGYWLLAKLRAPILAPQMTAWQFKFLKGLGALLMLQVLYGCLTSGLKAGFSFNTYPLMAGNFFPPGGLLRDPVWINFLENPATVQWVHRWLGVLVLIGFIGFLVKVLKMELNAGIRGPVMHLTGSIFVQIVLGILNIIMVVPVWLGAIHQLVAAMLVLSYFNIIFRLKIREK